MHLSRCEDGRCEGVKMSGCQDAKLRNCEDDRKMIVDDKISTCAEIAMVFD